MLGSLVAGNSGIAFCGAPLFMYPLGLRVSYCVAKPQRTVVKIPAPSRPSAMALWLGGTLWGRQWDRRTDTRIIS